MNRADTAQCIEELAKQFDDAPIGTVANQYQAQYQLKQPVLGHRQMEQDILITYGRRKGLIKRLLCLVFLLVDKLSANLMLVCQVAD